jgi:hypothetical protein
MFRAKPSVQLHRHVQHFRPFPACGANAMDCLLSKATTRTGYRRTLLFLHGHSQMKKAASMGAARVMHIGLEASPNSLHDAHGGCRAEAHCRRRGLGCSHGSRAGTDHACCRLAVYRARRTTRCPFMLVEGTCDR